MDGATPLRPASPSHGMDRHIVRSRWRRAWPALVAVTLIAAACIAAWQLGGAQSSVRLDARTAQTGVVTHGPFFDATPLRATVAALDTVFIASAEGGRVDRVLAEAGAQVHAGDALAVLDNTALQLDVVERETRIIEITNALRSTELSLEQTRFANARAVAESDWNMVRLQRSAQRRSQLAAAGDAPQEAKDLVTDELTYQRRLNTLTTETDARQERLATRQLTESEAELKRLDDDLALARSKLDALTVRAPADGVLSEFDLLPGEMRERGQRLGRIDRPGGYKLTVMIDEFYLGRVAIGQAAAMGEGAGAFSARVVKIYPQVQDGRFRIELSVAPEAAHVLRPGQSLSGTLALGSPEPALLLPTGAYLSDASGFVFVVAPDGRSAARRAVTLGRRTSDAVEVRSGLAEGERVLTGSYETIKTLDRIDLQGG